MGALPPAGPVLLRKGRAPPHATQDAGGPGPSPRGSRVAERARWRRLGPAVAYSVREGVHAAGEGGGGGGSWLVRGDGGGAVVCAPANRAGRAGRAGRAVVVDFESEGGAHVTPTSGTSGAPALPATAVLLKVPSPTTSPGRRPRTRGQEGFDPGRGSPTDAAAIAMADAVAAEVGSEGFEREALMPFEPKALEDVSEQ